MSGMVPFPLAAVAAVGLWTVGAVCCVRQRRVMGLMVYGAGVVVLGVYVGWLWWVLERPPLRTLGETRLGYALLLPLVAVILAVRWRMVWPLAYGGVVAALFLAINAARPEGFDKVLMPALQSPWFVPHVVVYLLAYAFLTASALGAVRFFAGHRESLETSDRAVWIGLALLTMGLLFGALWAKEAWGHYWTWDPKETWAFLTWSFYLAYVHVRLRHPAARRLAAGLLLAAVVVLGTCWFGVNYLPSAQASVHTYARD